MTSRGERKVRELALKRNGEQWNTNDVKELIFAFADDQEADHAESMTRLGDVEERLEGIDAQMLAHLDESQARDRRIANLEFIEKDRRKTCLPEVKEIVAEEHAKIHADYIASLSDQGFQSRLMWFFATTLGKFALVVLGILAGILLNLAAYGHP